MLAAVVLSGGVDERFGGQPVEMVLGPGAQRERKLGVLDVVVGTRWSSARRRCGGIGNRALEHALGRLARRFGSTGSTGPAPRLHDVISRVFPD